MLKIEFDNIKLSIPNSWNDIKLSDYERWHLLSPANNLEFVQYVADICKVDVKILLNAPSEVFNIIVNAIQPLLNSTLPPCKSIAIDDVNYSVERKDKLTLGEWVDVESVLNGESDTKISDILAIVCRPEGESYNPDRFDERKELFKSATCQQVLPMFAFFLNKKKQLEEITDRCSKAIVQGSQLVKVTENFVQGGDGIKRLRICQRIRYTYLTKSLKKRLLKFSDSYYTGLISQMQKNSNTNS